MTTGIEYGSQQGLDAAIEEAVKDAEKRKKNAQQTTPGSAPDPREQGGPTGRTQTKPKKKKCRT